MENMKSALRKSGRATALAVFLHQLLFQPLSAVILTFAALCLHLIGLPQLEGAVLYIASDIAMLISGSVFLIFFFANRRRIRENSPDKGIFTIADFFRCIIIILCANSIFSAAETLFRSAAGLSLSLPAGQGENTNPLIMLITVAVFPAIAEELIFRGVIYRYLRSHGRAFAAIASSLLFGLIHLNVQQFLFAACMGLVLCYAYERSGKLIIPMLLHFLNNSLTVLFDVLPVSSRALQLGEIILAAAALVSAAIFAAVRRHRGKKLLPINDSALGKKCGYFFSSLPMALLVLVCIAVCVLVIFI